MKNSEAYLLFQGCTYRKYNRIDLTKLPLPKGGEWVEAEEYCCGSNFYLMGNTEMADGLRNLNLKNFKAAKARTIVTPCPHCYTHLKRAYQDRLRGVQILHTVQLLSMALSSKKRLTLGGEEISTYHDPCLLGRLGGIYEEPRRVLSTIYRPDQIKEMKENRQSAPCCGSGWLVNSRLFLELAHEIAKKRLKDAEQVSATTLITACPSCEKIFNQMIQRTEMKLKVRDISEVFLEAMGYRE